MTKISTASSASTLILLQISARIFTFVFNQILVRIVSPTIFGLANIQLELLLSTILFLSREAIRNVLIRTASDSESKRTRGPRDGVRNSVHNISLLPIPIGLVLTVLTCGVYVNYLSPPEIRQVDTFSFSVLLYALGALIELLYEPLHIRALALGHPSLRVKAEGTAVLAKCIVTICAISFFPRFPMVRAVFLVQEERSCALLGFGLGQLAYGVAMLSVHVFFFLSRYTASQTANVYIPYPEPIQHTDSQTAQSKWLDGPTLGLCAEMSKQSLLKHGLTEADKFAIAKFATLEDQGGYALASNYGSLVARILFQPVEETARLVFSQDLVPLNSSSEDSKRTSVSPAILDRISALLSALFRLHFLLGAMLLTFGSPLSVAFLHVLAGPRWAYQTSAPVILGAYTAYLPIMGINGLVEGFFQSTASRTQVARYNTVLFLASMVFAFILAAPNLVAWLTGGHAQSANTAMVWANAGSLIVRAAYCWVFLVRYFDMATSKRASNDEIVSRVRPTTALPSKPAMTIFGAVAIAMRLVAPRLIPSAHAVLGKSISSRLDAMRLLMPILGSGFVGVLLCVTAVLIFDRHNLAAAFVSIRGSRTRAHIPTKKE